MFSSLHEGSRWEKATSVSEAARRNLCANLALKFVKKSDDCHGNNSSGLIEPELAGCRSICAEVSGKCWISSVFFLLTGKRSG